MESLISIDFQSIFNENHGISLIFIVVGVQFPYSATNFKETLVNSINFHEDPWVWDRNLLESKIPGCDFDWERSRFGKLPAFEPVFEPVSEPV